MGLGHWSTYSMDDCGCEYGLMYKGGVKGLDVGGYVSS